MAHGEEFCNIGPWGPQGRVATPWGRLQVFFVLEWREVDEA